MSRIELLPQLNNVVANQRFNGRLPLGRTYEKLHLQLGGTFTKAQITDLEIKVNNKSLIKTSGSDLDAMNNYRGQSANAAFLTVDLIERDAKDYAAQTMHTLAAYQEAGAQDLTIEGAIGAATAPTLALWGEIGEPSKNSLVCVLRQQQRTIAGAALERIEIPRGTQGGQLKRLYIFGASVTEAQVKRNGVDFVFPGTPQAVLNYQQQQYRKVPQAGLLVVDFVAENLMSRALNTGLVQAPESGQLVPVEDLDIRVRVSAGTTLTIYHEMMMDLSRI